MAVWFESVWTSKMTCFNNVSTLLPKRLINRLLKGVARDLQITKKPV